MPMQRDGAPKTAGVPRPGWRPVWPKPARLVAAAIAVAMAALPMRGTASAGGTTFPQHGLFQAQSGTDADQVRYCQLRAESSIDGVIFSLVLRWYPAGSLQAWFLSGNEGAAEAAEVAVAVDTERMLRFTPARRSYRDELSTLSSRIMRRTVGLAVEAMLFDAAEHARWFQVSAPPYEDSIPAEGLKEALHDLGVCRASVEM